MTQSVGEMIAWKGINKTGKESRPRNAGEVIWEPKCGDSWWNKGKNDNEIMWFYEREKVVKNKEQITIKRIESMTVKGCAKRIKKIIRIPDGGMKFGNCFFDPPEIPDMKRAVGCTGKEMAWEKIYSRIGQYDKD